MANQPKKYQKFVATAATATLVASAIVPAASAAEKNFTDIEKYAQETQDAIYSLVDRGVITGKSDSIFAPAESITRGQVVKMLGRYLVNSEVTEVPGDWASKARFTDLPVEYKDQDLVKNGAVVFDNGVFKGSNGKLNASNNITRENMALVLDRAILALNGKSLVQLAKEEGLKGNVKDIDSAKAEAREAILALNAFGISAVDNFNPKNDVNRAQFALFLERTIEAVLSDTTEELVEKAVVAGNALPKPEDVTKDNAADAQAKVDVAQKALDNAQKALTEDKELSSEEKLELQQKLDKVKDQIAAVKKAIADTQVTAGITSVKAINDTRVEVTFGKEIDKDFIREAELNGKYFAVYTEGNSVQSRDTVQSTAINFSSDGKTATFDLNDAIESGKKYYVALLDGDNKEVAEVVHSYGPAVLKSAADAPSFDVSAVADKIYVKYNTKMKDSAKDIKNYTVYDEGGQKLGPLAAFLVNIDENGDETPVNNSDDTYTGDVAGEWVNLNDKKEVEFQLGKASYKKLQAGKTYKLVVDEKVKTDDNKTLSESNRTIKVKTPSVKDASPVAKVARITGKDEITLYFDQNIVSPTDANNGEVNLNKAQLNLKTSTGKTVDVSKFNKAKVVGDNTLVITFTENVFDEGLTYKVDMPANVVQNGIFTNAMNEATTALTAKAQENISIKTMKAEIVADAKNDAKADLILTFDQVPNIKDLDEDSVVLFDGRDKYVLQNGAKVKVYGSDATGKSLIIEDIGSETTFKYSGDKTNKTNLEVKADKTYDIEIAKNALETATFDDVVPATNKEKLKASTKGISVSAPIIDEVVLQSAEKIEIKFKENIKGNVKASDIELSAFVANRSDIFEDTEQAVLNAKENVTGSGYFDVKVSGNTLTITAKTGVKFPTSAEDTKIIIGEKVLTNTTGKVGNGPLEIDKDKEDIIDNAAPVIVAAHANEQANEVTVTYSEAVKLQGNTDDVATLFFTDKGEESSEGVKYAAKYNDKSAVITFKEDFWKADTDLSVVTLKYSQGNSYYIQDNASNKMKTDTLKGFYTTEDNPTATETVKNVISETQDTLVNGENSNITEAVKAVYTSAAIVEPVADETYTISNVATEDITVTVTQSLSAQGVAEAIQKAINEAKGTKYTATLESNNVVLTAKEAGTVETEPTMKKGDTEVTLTETTEGAEAIETGGAKATATVTVEVPTENRADGKVALVVDGKTLGTVAITKDMSANTIASLIADKVKSDDFEITASGSSLIIKTVKNTDTYNNKEVKIKEA